MNVASTANLALTVVVPLALIALTVFVVRADTTDKYAPFLHLGATMIALLVPALFYPMFIAPRGPLSNGGPLGLGLLVISSLLAWCAFVRNRRSRWMKWLIQLPVTALVTYTAIYDGACYFLDGR